MNAEQGELIPLGAATNGNGTHPLALLERALEKNLSPESLKQFMDLAERWEAIEAKKEYSQAINLFKRNPPAIEKNRHVHYTTKTGHTVDYWHATLDHVCEQITQALNAVGISHRWETSQT